METFATIINGSKRVSIVAKVLIKDVVQKIFILEVFGNAFLLRIHFCTCGARKFA